jgi:hypothetical protein
VGLALIGLLLFGCSGPEDGGAPATETVRPAAIATIGSAATVTTIPATTATAGLGPTLVPASVTATSAVTPVVATETATVVREPAVCAVGVELLGYSDALDKVSYDDDEVGGLSALAWSGEGTTYYALSDRGSRVYSLDFPAPEDPTIVAEFRLRDASGEVDFTIDGEGIAVLPGGDLLVSSETEPAIRQYTADGAFIADLPVPEHFLVEPDGRAVGNGTFESLALSPSGSRLFAALEEPLEGDGATDEGQSRLRILRYDLTDGAFEPVAEYLYLAQPDQDVSEIAAISDEELLVLERGVSLIEGFSARIFRVSLDDAENVAAIERLEEADAAPVSSELLVDVADCPWGDLETFGDLNPLLANFESMAIGPPQADGRQTLIIGSDDNFESFLVTRYLVFAVDPPRF